MSYCSNMAIRCDECGKFCKPADEETPFGSKGYENPEPLDPYHYCRECTKILYDKWLKQFQSGSKYGYWQKSDAERRAAKDCGLVWIDQKGIGKYPDNWDSFCYVDKNDPRLL